MMPVLGIRVVGIEDIADRLRETYVSTVTYSPTKKEARRSAKRQGLNAAACFRGHAAL